MDGWIWALIFLVVSVIIFFLIWNATKLDTRRLGSVSREEFNTVAGRVNLMWALLIFWILMNLLYLLYVVFIAGSSVTVSV